MYSWVLNDAYWEMVADVRIFISVLEFGNALVLYSDMNSQVLNYVYPAHTAVLLIFH